VEDHNDQSHTEHSSETELRLSSHPGLTIYIDTASRERRDLTTKYLVSANGFDTGILQAKDKIDGLGRVVTEIYGDAMLSTSG
jgi:hypothetical protein